MRARTRVNATPLGETYVVKDDEEGGMHARATYKAEVVGTMQLSIRLQ